MAEKWQKWWKIIVIIGLVLLAVLLLVFIGYQEPWAGWTGFGEQQKSETTLPAKTLWDWLDLFIVSLVVALALFWLNTSQKRREGVREEARKKQANALEAERQKQENQRQAERQEQEKQRQIDNQHQATLLDYYDKMSRLILEQGLGDVSTTWRDGPDVVRAPVLVVARALTLAVFRSLDSGRNTAVLRFLSDAGLADKIPLAESTDMYRVNFHKADLAAADLKNAYLAGANLSHAYLNQTNLSEANLYQAKLSGAELREADLCWADLFEADLRRADLHRAKLNEAVLAKANLFGANLSRADLRGAKYTANTVWPAGFNPKEAGALLFDDQGKPIIEKE